jgi:peptide/nickel transport system ATP-binding protein
MLRVEGLTVKFPSRFGVATAAEDVSLSLAAGEIHGLVGESGAGKTTIGAAISGLIPAPGFVASGAMRLGDTDLLALSDRERHRLRGRRISMIFQDPQTSLNPLMTIEQQLVETILTHARISVEEARERAIALLTETGIQNAGKRMRAYPHQFSGGMRQRVVIALALCTEPELIIADEPTTALDVAVQSQVLALIRDLATAKGIGIILITHDIGVIAQVSDRVTVLRHGRVVEAGPTAQVLGAPAETYTRGLMASVPRLETRLARFALIESEPAPVTGKMPPGKSKTIAGASADFAAEWLMQRDRNKGAASRADTALELDGIGVAFDSPRESLFRAGSPIIALDGVSLQVPRGRVLGLVGESGSGKSTLAKVIVGLVNPRKGEMRFDGQALPVGRNRARSDPSRRAIQMVFQDPYSSLNNRRRIRDILAEPLHVYGIENDGATQRRLVGSFLELVGLPAAAMERYPHQFSGGQRQRIAVARALLARPEFLICDEPTSALDVSIQAQILNLLKDLQEQFQLSILFISHNLAVVRQMADRVAVLKDGRLVEDAESETFFENPQHAYSRQLLELTPSLRMLDKA